MLLKVILNNLNLMSEFIILLEEPIVVIVYGVYECAQMVRKMCIKEISGQW